jgi:hypothetical protein
MPDNKHAAFTHQSAPMNGQVSHASLENARSEEVQEIMGKMPPWILRSGISLIGILVLAAFTAAWFFRYPEVIPAHVVITPQEKSYVVKGSMAPAGAWKVKAGQKVLIRLTAYPYEEFGLLQGAVVSAAANTADTNFLVNISLDQQLRTTTGREIPAQYRLDGAAEIMTEDKSVLQRMFGSLWKQQ